MKAVVLVKPWKISEQTTIPGAVLKNRPGKENKALRLKHQRECEEEIYWIKSSERLVPSAQEFLNTHGYIIEQFGGVSAINPNHGGGKSAV